VPAKRPLAIDADELEAVVTDMVLSAFDDTALPAVGGDTSGGEEVARLEGELAELAALRGAGTISMAEWLAARAPLQERLDAAEVDARHSTRPSAVVRLLSKPGALHKAWPTLEFAERRAIVEAAIEKIIVGPTTRARWTPIEERLDPTKGLGVIWRA
jgi:site-specific DNA recombinase